MPVPERIGRFRVTGELGRGAMGAVYRGRDEALDRDVAIKVMSQGLSDPGARARFQKEAKAAARLQHPNIMVIYELGEHEGAPYMVLELLEGVDLQQAIDGGIRPDPRATLPLVLQVLAGLGHAHEHGIVHRDVKPSNVFLPFGRPAKVTDFGVARLSGLGTTTSGTVVGTPNYMSPEQVAAGELDGRSDLYSTGLILYELVTGEKAIKADTIVAAMYKIVHESPDLSLIPGGAPWQRLRAVLERSLARRREERYPDARAMSDELAGALVDLGGTVDWTAPADQALLVRPRPAQPTSVKAAPERVTPAARPRTAPAPAAGSGPPRQAPPAATPRSHAIPATVAAAVLLSLAVGGALVARSIRATGRAPVPPATPTTGSSAGTTRTASPPVAIPSAPPSGVATTATPAPTAGNEARGPLGTPPAAPAGAQAEADAPGPGAKVPAAAVGLGPEARLLRARELVARQRWAEALAEARAVLDALPTSAEATALAQQAEAELVVEQCLRNARAALRANDRERALEELRRGFLVRQSDPRLLELHREVVQQ
ncbi:MAG: protein kinase domain-containing protein [Betaproteobacteria bacterium]